jgi:ATP-dependent RNA helicase UAP56/SUB2
VSNEKDAEILKQIGDKFEVAINEFPADGVDAATYMAA